VIEYPHEITFQEEQSIPDGGGGRTKTWADVQSTEAFVDPVVGQTTSNETNIAQQAVYPVAYNVFIPYQDGIKPSMRIKYGEQTLKLKSQPIDQGGQGEVLMIKCELQ
jgi:SPP1 family predicted phage head-tail adaptor